MKDETIQMAASEAKRFLRCVSRYEKAKKENALIGVYGGSREGGDLRRSSMDLDSCAGRYEAGEMNTVKPEQTKGEVETKGHIEAAYLLYISINNVEEHRASFKEKMEQAKHAADVLVAFNGEKREFTLEEFMKLLGFKSEIEPLADKMTEARDGRNDDAACS